MVRNCRQCHMVPLVAKRSERNNHQVSNTCTHRSEKDGMFFLILVEVEAEAVDLASLEDDHDHNLACLLHQEWREVSRLDEYGECLDGKSLRDWIVLDD